MASKTAIVLGGTGAVGKALVRDLLVNGSYEKVVAIGRRPVELDSNVPQEKLVQKSVDFDNLDKYRQAFNNASDVYCCLGTTRAAAGTAENFVKIDQTYVLNSAKIIAEQNPPKDNEKLSPVHFLYCSSRGSNKDSVFLYPRSKGQTEEGLKQTGFQKVSLFHPGILIVEEPRPERRLAEAVVVNLVPSFSRFFGLSWYAPVGSVGSAMRKVGEGYNVPESKTKVFEPTGTKVNEFSNVDIDLISPHD
ncbi:hypothetical protein J3Q64DRAFT_1882670 [Phycomyces blakesleeanus]|uniref:NAD(P)-binding domain-containing protein n=2 Tax=Phycomyces blakesleeanus TaxID=4837 RepID=A0A167M627_PHYB8|nr:hypothetical protein PHYBLDRAFT_159214 [Phycomyces blakesleeanus NRRL 1555(-)]OAD71914.1 hypothetical protein PHYBLDRAFT_159214 [Phycomyces blakesleeanus NRRL 1555(-)]|eukprot:XP_018289954.1 hypothetical protein PHYBLDRAFT_159214 [Phycomyces blakesleeanus NRRL 1555(-)]